MPRSSSTWRDVVPGLIALAAIIGAAVAVLMFARIGALRGSTYELWAPTSRARGVMNHTEVWLEGQKVGAVKDVHFRDASADTGQRLVLHLEVLAKFRDQIRHDSFAQVRPGGSILGSPVVFVSTGSASSTPLRDGDTLAVLPQGDTEGMTSQIALASREFPRIIENVKLLNNALLTARGTVGAMLYTDQGVQQFETFATGFGELAEQATRGGGTVGLALRGRGNELAARARSAMAQADSLRQLLLEPGPRTTLGRFRRDSTIIRTVDDVRTELATVRLLLAEPRGTAGRVLADSAVFQQITRAQREMDALFKDLRRRPLRYIAF
ncbi:MAG TPA: MlaD family protein [Gemmatimonadaceae bacterium]|nr:MlaD family protein [Gemmatimonadaceae bacterium]